MQRKLTPFFASLLFLGAAFVWDSFTRKSFNDDSLANKVAENLNGEIASLEKEAGGFKDSLNFHWASLAHSFYLLERGEITAWSKNDFFITAADLAGDYRLKLLQTPQLDLLLYRLPMGEKTLIGIIPLRVGYEIVNRYLTTSWNKKIFPIQGVKVYPANENVGVDVCVTDHQCIFKIKTPPIIFAANEVSLGLMMFSILMVLLGVFFIVRDLHKEKKFFSAFFLLFVSLAIIRVGMVRFSLPGRWVNSDFFDPRYFASSSFNASLGDFFLNALIVAISCAYLFSVYPGLRIIKNSYRVSIIKKLLIATLLLLASFFAFLFPHLFVESIFHDSSISIDITTSVAFDGLRIVALGALVLGCMSSLFFVHVLIRWVRLLLKPKWLFVVSTLIAALFFACYFLFSDLNYWTSLFIGSLYFTALFFFRYFRSVSQFGSGIFSFMLIALIAYGTHVALGIKRFAEEKEVRTMIGSSGNLISRDVLGEYLLNETAKKIRDDRVIQSLMAMPLPEKDAVRGRVKQFYNNYFDRYAVKIKLYHADGKPADDGLDNFAAAIMTFQNDANKTAYDGIYLIHSDAPEILKRYLAVIPLVRNGSVFGYVVLDLSSRQIVPEQVYPELLVDNRFAQNFRNWNYSYAFFTKGRLVGGVGSFNFERDFDSTLLNNVALYSDGIKSKGYWFVGTEDETGRQAVVASERYPNFYILANFSFLFVVGIGLIFLILVIYLISQIRKKFILNYSTRIQLYVYLSFIVPLGVVSTIALRMISQSDDARVEKEIRDKGIQIMESISGIFDQSDSLKGLPMLQTKVTEIAQASAVDANVYNPSGKLLASSQPTIFNSHLAMPLPDREAWEKIVNDKFNIVQARCNIGLLDYNSLFFAIKKAGRKSIEGIVELPFLKPSAEVTKVSALSNILVTFVIVFIAFSLFAFRAIEKLTFPLRFIAKKLKTTSLGENQPIAWKANDEIGQMVREYNRMLNNLEQNKIDLVRNQKESAWREIAQQVAHEIKNPLTPMKLILQQMELAALNNSMDHDRTKLAIQTMLTQVDVLNEIAGSFSTFVKMPAPTLTRIDISILLRRTMALFENQEKVVFEYHPDKNAILVLGDDKLLGRIFSNIILNALQAVVGDRQVRLKITVKEEGNGCVIGFKDDGPGIAQELHDKIFLPHFSTKNTGSGLGLAIAKQGIEQMGGTIWFETAAGQGTTFFVRLKSADSML